MLFRKPENLSPTTIAAIATEPPSTYSHHHRLPHTPATLPMPLPPCRSLSWAVPRRPPPSLTSSVSSRRLLATPPRRLFLL